MRKTQNNTSASPISEQATAWFVRIDAGALTADERRQFDEWIAHPVHRAAYADVQKLWGELGDIDSPGEAVPSVTSFRFGRSAIGALLAASIVIAGIFAFDIPMRLRADALTATGEMRSIALPDGSRVALNTASAVAIAYTPTDRRVALLRGEASFTVAHDGNRPFTVVVDGGAVRALGTQFAVRLMDGEVRVTDIESRVSVTYPTATTAGVELSAGEQVRFGPAIGIGAIEKVDADAETAWRRGKLVFVDRPLGDVIKELNRYHRGAIRIVDPAIHARRVSGVFETENPVTIVNALESSLGLHSMRLTDYLILLHR